MNSDVRSKHDTQITNNKELNISSTKSIETADNSNTSKKLQVTLPKSVYSEVEDISNCLGIKSTEFVRQACDLLVLSCYEMKIGRRIGSIADITTFSFHAAKVMTTGEGGMITTDNEGLYHSMKAIVNQGYGKKKHSWDYEHPVVGFNYRMAEPQAAIGIEQLKKLPEFLYKRSRFAQIYRELLTEYCHPTIGRYIRFQQCNFEYDYYNSNFLFVVFVDHTIRDLLCQKLVDKGVGVKVTWKPVHQQIPYQQYYRGRDKEWQVADRMSKQVISLPIHNCLEEDDIVEICNRFRKCYDEIIR